MSRRKAILGALFQTLDIELRTNVRRNEVLPEKVPASGLVILREGDPGEPNVTLNPRTEFYAHRVELEVFVSRDPAGGGEAALDALLGTIGMALRINPSLGDLAENLTPSAPEIGALAVEGAAPRRRMRWVSLLARRSNPSPRSAADRTSCSKATANQFRLFLHAGAYWLMWALRAAMPKRAALRLAQFDTLRVRLIKIAARVVEMKTRICLHLPTSCPDHAILRIVLSRIPRLAT